MHEEMHEEMHEDIHEETHEKMKAGLTWPGPCELQRCGPSGGESLQLSWYNPAQGNDDVLTSHEHF